MVGRPRTALAGLAAAGLLMLGACTSSSADNGGSTPAGPVTATASVDAGTSGRTPASSAPASRSPEPSTTAPSTPATSSQPWPADFTPEQAAAARTAIEVYKNATRVTDEAYAEPGRPDLEPFIRQYIADPRANQVIRAAQSMAAKGRHTTGYTMTEVKATAIEANGVILAICIDSSQGDLIDNATGESIKAQLPVGPRVKQSAKVYDYGSPYGWLLRELDQPDPPQPC